MGIKRQRRSYARSDRVIRFIECLPIPSGKGQGGPFKLDTFQKKFIRDVYAEHGAKKTRKVRRAILSIARKNGKTALIAALVLVHLVGPEAIVNGEIYSAANDREQAGQVFKFVTQIIELEPELAARIKVVRSTKTLVALENGSIFKALSSDASTKHGSSPSVWIYDELAQSKNRELFDTLDTSQGGREEPLGIVISTQSNDPAHILSELIDDGLSGQDPTVVAHLYAVPDEQENIFDKRCWKKANPALGTFRSLEDFEAQARRARRLKSFENSFRNLYLNQRVSIAATLFSKSDWLGRGADVVFEAGEDVVLSLDLAGSTDLAALGMMSMENGARFKAWFFKPSDLIEDQSRRDRVRYDIWADKGHLDLSDGRIISPQQIALKIGELNQLYNVRGLAYDRWRIEYLLQELQREDIEAQKGPGDGLPIHDWGQGWNSMSPAIDALENLVLAEELTHDNNPVLTWNVANAVIRTDPAGNRKFDKEVSRMRIDGAVALAMAAGLRSVLIEDPEDKPSVYEERGLRGL